jgi:hypothetical protein
MSSPRLNPDRQIAKLNLAKSSLTLNPTKVPPHVFPGSPTLHPGEPPLQVTPDFDGFAVTHPWIGQKMGKIQSFPGGFGQQFQGATLYGVYGGNPNEVHGAIRDKYLALAGPAGFLGFPTTNETGTPDGKGRFNHFEHGSIYWHPSIGAFEVHGAIREKWASLGWEAFGYPLTDETSTFYKTGRFNHFRAFWSDGTSDRSIYYSPETGANDVRDTIRTKWSDIGWETGFLGYPVSGEYDVEHGRRCDFQNGSIAWSSVLGVQVQPERLSICAPDITFDAGIAVGGYGQLDVFSDGTTHLWGHFHDSGGAPYDCLLVFSVMDTEGRAYAAPQSGTVHGWDPGSRNMDWDTWGSNDLIRGNWAKIRSAHTGGYHAEVTSDWTPTRIADFVGKIAGAIVAVAGIITLIFGSAIFGGGGSGSTLPKDPNYGRPEDYPIGGEPPPSSGIQTIP